MIYWPGDSGNCEERAEPPNLHPCYGEGADYTFKWLKHTHSDAFPFPGRFAKWAVRPFVCRVFSDDCPITSNPGGDREQELANWRRINAFGLFRCKLQDEQFAAAFPAPVERNYFVWKAAPGGTWRGGADFPHAWISIEIFAGMMLDMIASYRTQRNADDIKHRIRELERETRAWLDRSRRTGRFTAVPAFAKNEFWRWYDGVAESSDESPHQPRHRVQLQACLAEAYRTGPRLCLAHSAEAAKLVPASYVRDQRWQLAVNLAGHGGRYIEHRLLGASPQGPTRDHVLMMQFDSQEGFDWMWGDVGKIQYWIGKQDLSALRFDDVIVTLSSG